jgi:LPS-assembly lipoprotein
MRILTALMLLLLAMPLQGCGYKALYAKPASGAGATLAMNQTYIMPISDRQGQLLRNYLIDRMYVGGRPAKPTTHLEILLTKNEYDTGIRKDATASRTRLDLIANYVLKDMEGKVLLRGEAKANVTYTILDAQYGTLVARDNASERAIREAGDKIINRLALYFSNPDAK